MQRNQTDGRPMDDLVHALSTVLPGVTVVAFDGSRAGPQPPTTMLQIASLSALAKIVRSPLGLGLVRAWVEGELDACGDLSVLVNAERGYLRAATQPRLLRSLLRASRHLRPRHFDNCGPGTAEYTAIRAGIHSIKADRREIAFITICRQSFTVFC